MDKPSLLIDVDSDEWQEFKTFCLERKVGYRIVYDYEYGIMVRLGVIWAFRFIGWITIGEEL